MKHVEIDRLFIKEKIDSGLLKLKYVKSPYQLTENHTKASINKMDLLNMFSPSRGKVLV